jgi:acylphosphatase
VWFRESTRREALSRGLAGWVRNLSDGDVEAVFEGEPAAVASAVAWAHHGPERAAVTSVTELAEAAEGLSGFVILG